MAPGCGKECLVTTTSLDKDSRVILELFRERERGKRGEIEKKIKLEWKGGMDGEKDIEGKI